MTNLNPATWAEKLWNEDWDDGAKPAYDRAAIKILAAYRTALIEACAAAIREKCEACEGTGYANPRDAEAVDECMYCGLPRQAIRALDAPREAK